MFKRDEDRLPLKRVIQLAAQREISDDMLTEAEIMEIAQELGIAEHHVAAAIDQLKRESASGDAGPVFHSRFAPYVLAGSAAATSLGIVMVERIGNHDALITAAASGSLATFLIAMGCATRLGGRWRYVAFNAANAIGWSFIALSVYPQAIDFSTPVFGALTALGGSFLLWHRGRQPAEPGDIAPDARRSWKIRLSTLLPPAWRVTDSDFSVASPIVIASWIARNRMEASS